MQLAKDVSEMIKTIVEVIAIVIGGIWTYYLFIEQRVKFPFVKTEHKIRHCDLESGEHILGITVVVTNAGKSLVNLEVGEIFVRQVIPTPKSVLALIKNSNQRELREGMVKDLFLEDGKRISWAEIGFRKFNWKKGEVIIEPGESEECHFDFVIDGKVQSVEVISYFRNVNIRKREIGWRLTSFYKFDKPS